ncbi:MAG: CDP-glycerol glycerophosphotransferase family protein [Candidatus Hodarchaeales archaeon]
MTKSKIEQLILVSSELKTARIKKHIQEIQKAKEKHHLVISLSSIADRSLTEYGISYEKGNNYLKEDQEFIEREVNYWVNHWILTKEEMNTSIFDNFKYKKESLWHLVETRVRFEILEVIILIKILQGIEKTVEPKNITVYDEKNRIQFLVPQVFNKSTTKIVSIKPRLIQRVRLFVSKVLRGNTGARFLQLREIWYGFLGRRILSKYSWKKKIKKQCMVTFTEWTFWRLCFNSQTNQFGLNDFYFQNIHNELNRTFAGTIVELYKVRSFKNDLRVVKEKHNSSQDIGLVFLDAYLNHEARNQLKQEMKFYKERFHFFRQKLLKDKDLVFSKVNFSPIMKKRLIWFFKAYIPLGLRWKAMFNGFISKVHPNAIFFINETFTIGRALTLSVKEHDEVISCALQHGFFKKFPVGFGRPRETDNDSRNIFLPPLQPDITAVYGPYYKQLLLDAGYSEEKILISGNPIYDQIHKLKRNISPENILKKLNLAQDKKIIVYGTQTDIYDKAVEPLNTVINLGEKNPDFQLVIKVHPHEDVSHYQQFEEGAPIPVRVVKDINILSLLNVCNLYLTQFSTTILDALVLGKPVAVFNYSNKNKLPRYMQTKAIIELTSPRHTEELIPKLLSGFQDQDQFITYCQEYLHDQIYKTDGKAAKRIVKAILN